MLTPMLVQYLVGLCCLRRNPDAVDITIGDMVLDVAAHERRDVDVTVTLQESPGVVRAFKAYEVKDETRPLDVGPVGELTNKLGDMPAITHRAIVSASGFTKGAQHKAEHHGVELFTMKPLAGSLEKRFPYFGAIKGARLLLCWKDYKLNLVAPTGPKQFSVELNAPVLMSDGSQHEDIPLVEELRHETLLRSTETLYLSEQATNMRKALPSIDRLGSGWVGAAWPTTFNVNINADDVHVKIDGRLTKIEVVTIQGTLQWQLSRDRQEFYLLERVPDGDVYAGASVALGERPGQMYCLVLSPDSPTIDVQFVRLAKKHLNAIRRLKLEIPGERPL